MSLSMVSVDSCRRDTDGNAGCVVRTAIWAQIRPCNWMQIYAGFFPDVNGRSLLAGLEKRKDGLVARLLLNLSQKTVWSATTTQRNSNIFHLVLWSPRKCENKVVYEQAGSVRVARQLILVDLLSLSLFSTHRD